MALNATVVTSKRAIPAGTFFRATATSSTLLDGDELIKEITIPAPPAGTVQHYEKFTLRKPIDFAIAGVAAAITVEQGVCKEARIVLGAVAPEPLRAKEAEDFLKGKAIDEATIREAGELALKGATTPANERVQTGNSQNPRKKGSSPRHTMT